MSEPIIIRGLKQNNLKNISLDIPKIKLLFLQVFQAPVNQALFLTQLPPKASVR